MGHDLPVPGGPVIPARELIWRFSRSSGPGGQSVNTTDSRVELRFDVARSPALSAAQRSRALARLDARLVDGMLSIVESTERSQLRNREAALRRLATLLGSALAPPPPRRRGTRPSRGSVQRRLSAKKQRGQTKRLRGSIDD